jgi:hypothetical protein
MTGTRYDRSLVLSTLTLTHSQGLESDEFNALLRRLSPGVRSFNCVGHLVPNVESAAKAGGDLRDQVKVFTWSAARAKTVKKFDSVMSTFTAACPSGANYLSKVPVENYAVHAVEGTDCGYSRHGHLHNGIVEGNNAWVPRSVGPLSLCLELETIQAKRLVERPAHERSDRGEAAGEKGG